MRTIRFLAIAFILLSTIPASAQEYKKLAPYSNISWESLTDEYPSVKIGEEWYMLIAINDISVLKIASFCETTYGEKARKRFNEDLVEVLTKMGNPPSEKVSLTVRNVKTRERITMKDVQMTFENREAIRLASLASEKAAAVKAPEFLSSEQINEDLDIFKNRLEAQFSYLNTNDVDYISAINEVRSRSNNGMSTNDFAIELQKIISLFIDGHAGISPFNFSGRKLPFEVTAWGTRIIAYKIDRTGFLADSFPYLNKIDDLDVDYWVNLGDDFRPAGSFQYKMRSGVRMLRYIEYLRGVVGITKSDSAKVELLSKDLSRTKTIKVALVDKVGKVADQKFMESQILPGNIGYLRLSTFMADGPAVSLVEEWMPKFKDADGIIIDVRGNGGGSRAALDALHPFLMQVEDEPSIANVSAYRMFSEFELDHLSSRFAYREDAPEWNERERSTIHEFMKSFKPQWMPSSEFSPWHFMLLSKRPENTKYFYGKPVIVLLNNECFSATDIFLGALKGWRPNIKLVGEPSGGGSARSVFFSLKNSQLLVRNASMVSYQRNGALYDTNGIHPDFLVYPDPEFYLENGSDYVLEKAKEIIKGM